MAVWLL